MTNPFDGNYIALIREISAAARLLDKLPDDQEWTMEQLDTLESLRHACLHLVNTIEATIEVFEGIRLLEMEETKVDF